MSRRLAAIVLLALVAAAPAAASEQSPRQAELEAELICPECATTLNQSNAPIARRMKGFVAERIAAGDTKSEIKDKLVAQFGPSVLAAPPREGFDLIAWVLPLAGLAVGAVVLGVAIRRWTRSRATPAAAAADPSQNGAVPLEPDLERKLDEALARFE